MDTKSPALYSNKGKAEVLEDYGRKKGPERTNSNRPENAIRLIRLSFAPSASRGVNVYLHFLICRFLLC